MTELAPSVSKITAGLTSDCSLPQSQGLLVIDVCWVNLPILSWWFQSPFLPVSSNLSQVKYHHGVTSEAPNVCCFHMGFRQNQYFMFDCDCLTSPCFACLKCPHNICEVPIWLLLRYVYRSHSLYPIYLSQFIYTWSSMMICPCLTMNLIYCCLKIRCIIS